MLPEEYNQALDVAWEQLKHGECFFVRCLDAQAEKKKILARGYAVGKPAPRVRIGVLDGFFGVLCFRNNFGSVHDD